MISFEFEVSSFCRAKPAGHSLVSGFEFLVFDIPNAQNDRVAQLKTRDSKL